MQMRLAGGRLDRRSVLRGTGVLLSLPFLEAMMPRRAPVPAPRTLAVFTVPFGMVEEWFHPSRAGFDYEPGSLLAPLALLRERFTVFSNLDHALTGGHSANHTMLSGVWLTERSAHPDGNVTLDQRAAEILGNATRFPSLVFGDGGMSFTRTGVRVPSLRRPNEAFRRLFVEESEDEKRFLRASLKSSQSILDAVREDARSLERVLGRQDREKLDEYFTSIRGTEAQLGSSAKWLDEPKPAVDDAELGDVAAEERGETTGRNLVRVWYDLMYLALLTDSTRIVVTSWNGGNWGIEGVSEGYHTLSHHGHRGDRLQQLRIIEQVLMDELARFLGRLETTTQPDGSSLLDTTQVLFGSGLGNGNRHTNTNLPLILAGGGFRHGQHLDARGEQPLCNLYLSMLQAMECEVERFNLSTGTLAGLERAPGRPR